MGLDILINQDTRQVALLDNFTEQAGGQGVLYVYVDSLPLYLSTPIAFSIFNYKLRNYPRNIIWRSKKKSVLEVLKNTSLVVESDYVEPPATLPEVSKKLKIEKKKVDKLQPAATADSKQNKESKQTLPVDPPQPQKEKQKTKATTTDTFFDFHQLAAEKLQHVEAGELPQQVRDTVQSGDKTQFDSWLKKIEATKSALDDLKGDKTADTRIRVAGDGSYYSSKQSAQKKPKMFMLMSTLFSSAAALITALILFPSSVYTLSVAAPVVEGEISLSIPTKVFSKQTVTISEQATRATSGSESEETIRAKGQINLVNESREPVILTSGEYYFDFNDARYITLSNQTLPDAIVIPPQNQDSIILDVQALENGNEYNIQANERLEIYNLLGQKMCEGCYAKTISSIEAADNDQDRTVSLADQDALRNTVDTLIAQKRVSTYVDLASSTAVTDPSWYQNIDSVFVFNHGLGDKADELTLEVDVNTNLFYLSENELYKVLEQENSEVDEVIDIKLQKTSGDFSSEGEIDITLLYRYKRKTELDKEKITDMLKEKELSDAQAEIQNEFPSVKRIARQETGVSIPGIAPRVNVNIVETQ